MAVKSKVLKVGVGYTIGNILLHCMGIFTLPIFTRLLTTSEYGQYGIFMSYASILLSIVSCALHTSVRSAKIEFGERIDEYTSSITTVYFVNLSILLIISLLSPQGLCELLGLSNSQLVLLSIYTFGTSMMNLYNTRLSLDYSVKKYIKLSALNSIVSLCLSLVLMYTLLNDNRILGRLLGLTIAVTLVSGISLYSLFKKARPKFNPAFLSFGLKYSAPLIAHGVAQTLLVQFDRIMIKSIVGLAEAGIYSFGGSIKTLLNVVADSLNTVWATWFFDEMAKNNVSKVKRKASEYTLLVLIFGVSAIFVAPEVVKILGSKEYWDARFLAPPMVLDSYVMFIYAIIVQAEYYTKKTHYVLVGTVIAAIINIITNVVFINLYGYIAAAYTTLFAYTCYLMFHIIIAHRAIGFHVVAISQHLIQGFIMALCAVICLIGIENWLIRWAAMIFADIIIAYVLIKMVSKDGDFDLQKAIGRIIHR